MVFDGAEYDTWSNLTLRRLALPDEKYCERKMQLVEILGGQLDRGDEARD